MALINCQECGKEVSDNAKICVHCGFRFPKRNLHIFKKHKMYIMCSIAFVLVAVVVSILSNLIPYKDPELNYKMVDKTYDIYGMTNYHDEYKVLTDRYEVFPNISLTLNLLVREYDDIYNEYKRGNTVKISSYSRDRIKHIYDFYNSDLHNDLYKNHKEKYYFLEPLCNIYTFTNRDLYIESDINKLKSAILDALDYYFVKK